MTDIIALIDEATDDEVDRAVRDARLIHDLQAELARHTFDAACRTAELDQANARTRDLDAQVTVLIAVAHRLGVTCVHPTPNGVIVHVDPTKETP